MYNIGEFMTDGAPTTLDGYESYTKMRERETIKRQIEHYLLNMVDENGILDLSNLDFGDATVLFTGIKAGRIDNSFQSAGGISNRNQKARYAINNAKQRAGIIENSGQEAEQITNNRQHADSIYDKDKWTNKSIT